MKTGTPEASSAFAPAGSRLMFHSASGGRRSPLCAVVAAIDAAAHHHHPLELAKGGRVPLDGRLHVEERADGDQRDLAGVGANLVEQERNRIGMLLGRL